MWTRSPSLPVEPETRPVFRILAGVIALFVALVGLPAAILEARAGGGWQAWFGVASCYLTTIGLAMGARTGRWPFTFGEWQRR